MDKLFTAGDGRLVCNFEVYTHSFITLHIEIFYYLYISISYTFQSFPFKTN